MKQPLFRVAFVLLAIFGVSWAAAAQIPDPEPGVVVGSGFVYINAFGLPYIQELGHYEGLRADPNNPGLARGAFVGMTATPGCQKFNAGLIGIDTSPGVVSLDVVSLNDTQAPRFAGVFRTINTDTTPTLSLTLPVLPERERAYGHPPLHQLRGRDRRQLRQIPGGRDAVRLVTLGYCAGSMSAAAFS